MEAAPRLWDQEEPENVIRGESSPRRPELGSFSDLQGEGPLSWGKQSRGQEANLGSRHGGVD